jgi:hypothetical protein
MHQSRSPQIQDEGVNSRNPSSRTAFATMSLDNANQHRICGHSRRAARIIVVRDKRSRQHGQFAQPKTVAERNVIRIAPRSWPHTRIPMLVDLRTGLLRNNVRTICYGRGERYSGNRYTRFVCVLRPWPLAGQRQLFVTYRAFAHGGFGVHWLRLRRS